MAEKEGFEPSVRCRTLPFQGSAIDHSAISPAQPLFYLIIIYYS